jgi:hypothetical protein
VTIGFGQLREKGNSIEWNYQNVDVVDGGVNNRPTPSKYE